MQRVFRPCAQRASTRQRSGAKRTSIHCREASHLVGTADEINVTLAWTYVGLRIVHSLIQCTANFVPVRFAVFVLASLALLAMTVRNVVALFPGNY